MAAVPARQTREGDGLSLTRWKMSFERKQVSHDPIIAKLDVEYNELLPTWRKFQEYLSPEDRIDFQERPQTVEDVLRVVCDAADHWTSSERRHAFWCSTAIFSRVAASMESHSIILSVLPDKEVYSSLLYAVLLSVIKALKNYYRIAEGIFRALADINEAIRSVAKEIRLRDVPSVIHPVAKLYSQVFLFLGEFMDWYIGKANCRMLDSHNQDFYSDFEDLICTIASSSGIIVRELTDAGNSDDAESEPERKNMQSTASYLLREARLSQAGLEGDDRRVASQNAIIRQLIWDMQHDAGERNRMREEREVLLSHFLDSLDSKIHCFDDHTVENAEPLAEATEDSSAPSINSLQGSRHRITRIRLQLSSKDLQDFFDNYDQIYDFNPDAEIFVDSAVIRSLRKWTRSLRSRVLAIAGPHGHSSTIPVTLISAYYASSARQQKLPIISHFCSLPRKPPPEGTTPASQALIALIYSIIRQLTEIAPPVLDCDSTCDLSAERFCKLDGTLKSWKEALSVLDALLRFAPPILFCVIDRLDVLEDPSTDGYIQSFVQVLVRHTMCATYVPANGNTRLRTALIKVLFTVAGKPRSLLETLSEDQLVFTQSLRAEHPRSQLRSHLTLS